MSDTSEIRRLRAMLKEFIRLACSDSVADEDWLAIVDEASGLLADTLPDTQ